VHEKLIAAEKKLGKHPKPPVYDTSKTEEISQKL
jgi:hypothetical protein